MKHNASCLLVVLLGASAVFAELTHAPLPQGTTILTELVQYSEHYQQSGWKKVTLDLTAWAGKRVTIRLLNHPGPKNNCDFDTAYIGQPQLVCGEVTENDVSERIAALTGTRAYRETVKAGLKRMVNDPTHSILPGNAVSYANRIQKTDSGYAMIYAGEDGEVTWRYTPVTGTLDDFLVQFDGAPPFSPAKTGGVYVSVDNEEKRLEGGLAVSLTTEDTSLKVVWAYPNQDQTIEVTWRFSPHGKALVVEADSSSREIQALSLGESGDIALRRWIHIPYLHRAVDYLPQENVFALRFFDWTKSHSSKSPEHQAKYNKKTDGQRNPIHEVGYIAISPNVHEVLPNIPHPASPYREMLAPMIMLDVWNHYRNSYAGDTENILRLKDNGIDHLAIIQHVWQRYGYDVKLPNHFPADPQFGTDKDLIAFGETATRLGYPWSLHENYIDIYPDAPLWDPTAVVLNSDGTRSKAWFHPGTKIQSFGIKCNRALEFAKANAPHMHERYKTTAGYLDVHTGVHPWHQLDHDATQPMAAMALHKVKRDPELFQYLRETHEGPLLGEGHKVFYWAGLYDGAETQVEGGENHVPLLDFNLLKIHPQMVNHGMGYYVRWYNRGWDARWGIDTGTPKQLDKYRAQQIAYGQAGFIGREHNDHVEFIAKEHHLMHPIQRLMGAAIPTEIRYEIDGQWVTASVALALDIRDRQRIRYDSGLTLWVNWRDEPWRVEGRTLPQWGFLAIGPDTEVWTALKEGMIADYAECPEFVYADARTRFNMPYVNDNTAKHATVDFSEHLNPKGTTVDFGSIITDGAVKVQRDDNGLVVFPYPRDTEFTVTLDLSKLKINLLESKRISIHALEARTKNDLGAEPFTRNGTRITFTVGTSNAGRYWIKGG